MFGEIEGVTEGQIFENRRELHDANVHKGLRQGIGSKGALIVPTFTYSFRRKQIFNVKY